ncbi:MAG TPA: tripartite tricarboxylate transporter substrate binding protein [Burkholderiales bacterium]|nr:tripartite tricarboxylate transporter substrate binding protein [Burkholderiales bacterium]
MHQVNRRIRYIAASIPVAAALAVQPLHAQESYPEKPVRLIVPFPPGGQTDNVARHLGVALTSIMKQQVVIDNRGGAAGTIGSAEVARAKPDGYTLLIATSSTHAINPIALPNVQYDPLKDFTQIAVLGTGPIAISVHPIVPARTLQQLVSEVKARPGYYSYASSGIASINHLAGELFKMRAGNVKILHVPYRGAGPSMQDLIGGQIEMVCSTLSAALPHHRNGRVRTLAILKEGRSVGAPDIPTAIESGVPGAVAYTFNILMSPANTPRNVVDAVSGAVARAMSDRAFVDTLVRIGVDPVTDSKPETAAAMVRNELAKWKPVVQAVGLASDSPVRATAQRRN